MGLFDKLLSKNNNKQVSAGKRSVAPECETVTELQAVLDNILSKNCYVARSEYKDVLPAYEKTADFFAVLENSGQLDAFCKKNRLKARNLNDILNKYRDFQNFVDDHNEKYVSGKLKSEKEYLDGILRECDPGILLDEDQRKVVLSDEDYTLVIAGAGAGKTTTVAAKVKYLVDKQGIDPKQILVVSFTNKAVGELRERINKQLKIDCPIATFHSTGNAILHKQNPEKLNIVDDSKLYFVLLDYFKRAILNDKRLVDNLILFFGSYFDAPFEGKELNEFFYKISKSNYTSLRSDLNEFERQVIDIRSKKAVTIQSEMMRSYEEVEIANFLYLNGIDYEYEPIYPYDILFARKPYTPDFVIRQGENVAYIEHFGLTQNGQNNRYTSEQIEKYKKAIRDKIELHRTHKTKLIYTFSSYNDGRSLTAHLREELYRAGFVLSPRPSEEILKKIIETEENRYIRKLLNLICRFINNFKVNGYTADEFNRMYHSTANERSRLFLNICNECYLEYDRYLKAHNAVDFQDMINESARVLRNVAEMKQKLDFRYIIVDEYQDISRQRFDLVSALHEVTDAKIIAVGDDWQSIYAFSGSDISLFTGFKEKMGYAKLLKIVHTYRNSQDVINIAGGFIQKNKTQIEKELVSPKNIKDPVIIYTYNAQRKKFGEDNRSGANYELARAVETALEQIIEYNRIEGKTGRSSILLLGRYGFDGDHLERSGLFEFIARGNKIKSVKYPALDITFMTAHASKGLGYDNVIIVNCKNETFGFPSKIEDDPVLAFVIKGDRSIDYAEERRLFYVAMTRTKNRVYMVAPEQNPSEFLLEIKHDYKNVVLKGEWNENPERKRLLAKTCPLCGYPMQLRYKRAYGLKLFLCTNEPEVCGFMTNEMKAGKLSIIKCDQCHDGYLVVKPGTVSDYFLGCTNYKSDKTGCSRRISKEMFYEMNGYAPDPVVLPEGNGSNESINRVKSTSGDHSLDAIWRTTELVKAKLNSKAVYRGYELNDVVYLTLSCLNHISVKYYYGVNMLVDVLTGDKNERLIKFRLDSVPEYGALREFGRGHAQTVIYWLIGRRLILRTREAYPRLHPTYEGQFYGNYINAGYLKKLEEKLSKGEDGAPSDKEMQQ